MINPSAPHPTAARRGLTHPPPAARPTPGTRGEWDELGTVVGFIRARSGNWKWLEEKVYGVESGS